MQELVLEGEGASAPQGTVAEVALLALRLGFTAFGGPAAHIAMLRDEVVTRRKWVSDAHFLDLLGATNLIPGPNSTPVSLGQLFWSFLKIGAVLYGGGYVLLASCREVTHMRQAQAPGWIWFISALVLAALVPAILPAQAEETGTDGAMVTMVNRTFQPFALTVHLGQTVTWTNADGEPHTIIADSGSFATGYIGAGQQFSYTFEQPGSYTYYCDIHQGMEGEITVRSRLFLPVVTKEAGEQL